MLKVLFYRPRPASGPDTGPEKLLAYLDSTNRFQLEVRDEPPSPAYFADFDVVVLGAAFPLISTEEARLLADYVQQGGGLVCLGESADSWGEHELLQTTFGLGGGRNRTERTELIVRVPALSDHPVTRRLAAGDAHDHYAGLDRDTAFALSDSFCPAATSNLAGLDRQVLLLVSWRGERLPAAWLQSYGRGYLFYTGLGAALPGWAHPAFQQILYRAICYTGGELRQEARPVRVAMVGYGAIGFEHGTAVSVVPGLEFAAVCDRNPARLEEARRAFEGVKLYQDYSEVLRDPQIDLAIISTPPNLHAPMALELLEAGKHVVVEKPFCLTVREADAMLEKARQVGRMLSVYQCRRWDPDYLAIKGAVEAGMIGDLFHVETFIGGFSHPCDYWHSHAPVSGGVFYDWGSHYLDWILGLMPGQIAGVSGSAHKRVWHDVTNEDQAKVVIRYEGGQEAEFIHSDIAAALKPKWYILGTKGAIVAHWREETVTTRRWSGDLIEERLAPSEALPRLTAHVRQEDGLIHTQDLTLPPAPVFPFHRNLANHLLLGEPLAVRPEQARRNIAVMEAARRSAFEDGQFISLESYEFSSTI